jgi:hypothetical protein
MKVLVQLRKSYDNIVGVAVIESMLVDLKGYSQRLKYTEEEWFQEMETHSEHMVHKAVGAVEEDGCFHGIHILA